MFKDENCLFCNKKFENHKKPKLPEAESILYQDQDFYIMVDIAPLTRGHILIIPNKHIYNFNQLSLQEKMKVDCMKKFISTTFKEKYSLDTMFFEHGSTENNNGGGSIDHAHLHCLPFQKPINESITSALNKSPINLNIFLNDDYDKNKSYIYLEEFHKTYLYDVQNLPSQFLRKIIADNSGQNEYRCKIYHLIIAIIRFLWIPYMI